jgi:Ribbon-helix-helix protein, copG family
MGTTITVRLNEELAAWLEEAVARRGVSKSEHICDQLEKARASGRAFYAWPERSTDQRTCPGARAFRVRERIADTGFLWPAPTLMTRTILRRQRRSGVTEPLFTCEAVLVTGISFFLISQN